MMFKKEWLMAKRLKDYLDFLQQHAGAQKYWLPVRYSRKHWSLWLCQIGKRTHLMRQGWRIEPKRSGCQWTQDVDQTKSQMFEWGIHESEVDAWFVKVVHVWLVWCSICWRCLLNLWYNGLRLCQDDIRKLWKTFLHDYFPQHHIGPSDKTFPWHTQISFGDNMNNMWLAILSLGREGKWRDGIGAWPQMNLVNLSLLLFLSFSSQELCAQILWIYA